MNSLLSAICWAAALMLVAGGHRLGLIGEDAAQLLFVLMPVVAFCTFAGQHRSGKGKCA